MSTTTQEHGTENRRNRQTPPASPIVGNGQDTTVSTVTIEIAGMEVTLPVKFAPGHVLTENQARVLDAAYQRQFTNNQNALAKSRAENLTKATTDQDRAKYAALTADQLVALYADYEPNVGGTPRQSAIEKIRADAAWRVFLARVSDHNKAVASGQPGLFKGSYATANFTVPTGKGSVEWRDGMIANVLANDTYAAKVQEQIDLLMAERASKTKAESKVPAAQITADDLI